MVDFVLPVVLVCAGLIIWALLASYEDKHLEDAWDYWEEWK